MALTPARRVKRRAEVDLVPGEQAVDVAEGPAEDEGVVLLPPGEGVDVVREGVARRHGAQGLDEVPGEDLLLHLDGGELLHEKGQPGRVGLLLRRGPAGHAQRGGGAGRRRPVGAPARRVGPPRGAAAPAARPPRPPRPPRRRGGQPSPAPWSAACRVRSVRPFRSSPAPPSRARAGVAAAGAAPSGRAGPLTASAPAPARPGAPRPRARRGVGCRRPPTVGGAEALDQERGGTARQPHPAHPHRPTLPATTLSPARGGGAEPAGAGATVATTALPPPRASPGGPRSAGTAAAQGREPDAPRWDG